MPLPPKISFAKNIEFPKKAHRRKMGPKREGLMQMVNTAVNSNQSILPNGYDLDGFNNDVKLLKDINEMLAKNEAEIRQPLLATKAQVCHQIMKNVDNAHGFVKLGVKTGVPIDLDLVKKINAFTAHKNIRYTNSKGVVGKGEGFALSKVAGGTKFKNIGETVLEISKGSKQPAVGDNSIIQVLPDKSVKLPKGFNQVFIKNVSQDMEGSYQVKLRLG